MQPVFEAIILDNSIPSRPSELLASCMPDKQSFADRSYQLHAQHLQEQTQTGVDPLSRLLDQESIHAWRHERMYRLLDPLLAWGGRWLTVGDGIGTDANWLGRQGAEVVASDIGDALLKQAQERGFIGEYRRENAEQIQLPDNAFEFALCKEAYHHFPRPYLAVYEMLRVSSKAIVFIEPQDPIQQMPLLLWFKNILDRFAPGLLSRIWKNQYSFETVGNYVYKISEREMEKVAMGMALPAIAICGLNDYFTEQPGLARIPPNPGFFRWVKFKIGLKNLFCRLGFFPYRLLCCVIFKELPPEAVVKQLRAKGYRFTVLPENPYAN